MRARPTACWRWREKPRAKRGSTRRLQSVFTAVLLKPEAVYRFEVGDGKPDEFGRVFLAPYELKYAISYALTDAMPDAQLEEAAARGKLATQADVRREVERLLGDFETSSPRLLRFFQEYFEYTNAPAVFKDHRQANAIFATERVEDADELVLHILKQDQQVLRHLLTDDTFFIASGGLPKREPVRETLPPRLAARLRLPLAIGSGKSSNLCDPSSAAGPAF